LIEHLRPSCLESVVLVVTACPDRSSGDQEIRSSRN
jgi:hypothetical protein